MGKPPQTCGSQPESPGSCPNRAPARSCPIAIPPAKPGFGCWGNWGLREHPCVTQQRSRVTPAPQKGANTDPQLLRARASPSVRPKDLMAMCHPLAIHPTDPAAHVPWCQEPQSSSSLIMPRTVGSLPDDGARGRRLLPLLLPLSSGPGKPTPTALSSQGGTRTGKACRQSTGVALGHARHMVHGMQTVLGLLCAAVTAPVAVPGPRQELNHSPTARSGGRRAPGAAPAEPSRAERSRERKEEEEAKAAVGRGPGGRRQEAERAPKQREVRGGGGEARALRGRWDRPTAKQEEREQRQAARVRRRMRIRRAGGGVPARGGETVRGRAARHHLPECHPTAPPAAR